MMFNDLSSLGINSKLKHVTDSNFKVKDQGRGGGGNFAMYKSSCYFLYKDHESEIII